MDPYHLELLVRRLVPMIMHEIELTRYANAAVSAAGSQMDSVGPVGLAVGPIIDDVLPVDARIQHSKLN